MRKAWQQYVAEVRRKGNRGKSTMTHQEAMKTASLSWPKKKAKIERLAKKAAKAKITQQTKQSEKAPPARKIADSSVESVPV